MKLFELRYLNESDSLVLSRSHAAQSDFDALIEAERGSITHTVEVWEGDRKVARVKKGCVPLRIGRSGDSGCIQDAGAYWQPPRQEQ